MPNLGPNFVGQESSRAAVVFNTHLVEILLK